MIKHQNKINNTKCPICSKPNSKFYIKSYTQLSNKKIQFSFFKCEFCFSIFLKNPPNPIEMDEYYKNNYIPYLRESAWGKYKNLVKLSYNKTDLVKIKLVSKFFKKIDFSKNILDYGCGNPSFLKSFYKKFNANCYGFDLNNEYINNLKKSGVVNEIKMYNNDFKKNFENIKFDIITLWHSLEHQYDPVSTLRLLKKNTSINGMIFIEVPCSNTIMQYLQKGYWAGFHTPRHTVVFSKNSLQLALKKAGFKIIAHQNKGSMDPFILWWLGHIEKFSKKNFSNFEKFFIKIIILKILTFPLFLLQPFINLGIQFVVAIPNNES